MGFIYIIKINNTESNDLYKIGKTMNINTRFAHYPKCSELILCIKCENYDNIEKIILNLCCIKFERNLGCGSEYFNCNPNDITNTILSTILFSDIKFQMYYICKDIDININTKNILKEKYKIDISKYITHKYVNIKNKNTENDNKINNKITNKINNHKAQKNTKVYCNICNKHVCGIQSFKRHCLTKKHIQNIKNDNKNIQSECITLNNKNTQNIIIKSTTTKKEQVLNIMRLKIKKGNKNVENFNCEFCSKELKSKIYLRKHLKLYCNKVPTEFREELLEKHNARKNTKNKILFKKKSLTKEQKSDIETKQFIKNINNTQNYILNKNKHFYINGQKVKQTKLLKIYPFLKESTNHITLNDKIAIFNQPNNYIINYMNFVYNNLSNQNMFFANKNKGIICYLDDTNSQLITQEDIDNYIENQLINYINKIKLFFSEVESMLSAFNRKKINEYLQKYEDDDIEENKRLKKQIYVKLRQMTQEINNRIDNIIINENEKDNSKEYLSYSHLKNEMNIK
jgi:hypothetical protein